MAGAGTRIGSRWFARADQLLTTSQFGESGDNGVDIWRDWFFPAAAPASVATPLRPVQRAASFFQQGADLAGAALRYNTIVLNEWNADRIPTFRAANPNVRILLYKSSFFLREDDNASTVGGFATGENIDANHPTWFMLDAGSARIADEYYPGVMFYVMDWGNSEWQAYWLKQTLASLALYDWDGVFADDLYCLAYGWLSSGLLNYADDAALQVETRRFLATAYAGLQAAGYQIVPNLVGNKQYHPGLWTDWLTISDGLMDEHWGHTGTDAATGYQYYPDGWADLCMEEIALSEAAGKRSIVNTDAGGYGGSTDTPPLPGTPDHESAMYGYCLYLMAAAGYSEWFASYGSDYDVPLYLPIQDVQLGAPLTDRMVKSDGLVYRPFERGEVHVNTHITKSARVPGRGWLDADTMTPVQTRTLAPTTGCILLRPGYE